MRDSRDTNENLLGVTELTPKAACNWVITALYRGANKRLVISITVVRDGAHKIALYAPTTNKV